MTRAWITTIGTLALLLHAWAGFAVAQDEEAAAETDEPTEAVEAAEAEAEADAPSGDADSTASESDADIRFQFDGVPYSHVIERFAAMTEKPLIRETTVEGTLTFSDPEPYSYPEAFDAINLILATKQAALIEQGRFLKLVSIDQLERTDTPIFRGLDDTGDARPGEVVTVVLELTHIQAADILEAVQAMLSPAGSVAPMTRDRGLIMTDRLSSIERVQRLVAEVDTDSAVQRQMKTYTLTSAPGAVLADLINQTFGEATAPRRLQFNRQRNEYQELSPSPEDYVTAVFNEPSRTLILFGARDRITLAEQLIDQFEDETGSRAGEVKIFYPGTQSPDDLARIIREAIPGVSTGPNASSTEARIIVDNAASRLIVTAPAASQLDEIEQLIYQVDEGAHAQEDGDNPQPEAQRLTVTRVHELADADLETAEQAITQATTTHGPGNQTKQRLQITIDRNNKRIIVTGAPGDVQTAEEIIEQLQSDQPLTPRTTQLIALSNDEEAQRLLPLVRDLYQEQRGDASRRDAPAATIMTDPGNGRLIVSGTQADIEQISDIVEKLRIAEPPRTRSVEVITFESVQVGDVLDDVRSLVDEAMNTSAFRDDRPPLLISDTVNNRLIVTATEPQLEQVQEIVATLDVQPNRATREIFVVELEHKSADEIIPTVNDLYSEVAADRPSDHPAAQLMPHAQDRRIIVLATPDDYERISELIDQFDQDEPVVPRETRTIELAGEDAEDLAPLVTELYQEQRRGAEPEGGLASITTDRSNRRLIVTGTEDEIQRVEGLIAQLTDTDSAPAAEETRVFRLQQARASQIQGLIDKSLNGDRSRPIVRILLDEPSNSLILSGTPENLDAAAELIDQLDQQPDRAPRRLRLIDLSEADAEQLEPLISNLFEQMMREQHGANYETETRIFADGGSNRIAVLGPEDEVEHVADLVAQLDKGDPREPEPSEVFTLEHADAERVAEIMTDSLTRLDPRGNPITEASVTADPDTNSVIVSGSAESLRSAREIAQRLDTPREERAARELHFVDVEPGQANELARLAGDLYREQAGNNRAAERVTITADASNDRLIVIAPATEFQPLEQLIQSLGRRGEDAPRSLHRLTLTNGTTTDLLNTIQQLYNEQTDDDRPARLIAGPDARTILVVGSDEQVDQVRDVIATLEPESADPARETRYLQMPSNRELTRLRPLIEELYREEVSDNPDLGDADANFLVDSEGARLIVTAAPNHLDRIETIYQDLRGDEPEQAADRQTRIFEVGTEREVSRLLPLVRDLYQEQLRDRSPSDDADAQILSDPEGGRIIVTARPAHIEQIEQIIEQLSEQGSASEPRETRVYELDAAEAPQLSQTLRQLYEEHAADRPGVHADRVLILPDAETNRLIVTAPEGELAHLETLLEQLDQVSEQTGDTRVFQLTNADAPEVADLISSALVEVFRGRQIPRVAVGAHEQTNTLIISGEADDLRAAALIVQQLDDVGEQQERLLQTFVVHEGSASDLAQQASQLLQEQLKGTDEAARAEALILPDPQRDRLIVTATEGQLQVIEQIMATLNPEPSQEPRETRVYELTASTATELARTVTQFYDERADSRSGRRSEDLLVLPDAATNRLIVTGVAEQLDEVEDIIEQIDQVSTQTGDTRLFRLKTSEAEEVASLLSQAMLVPDARGRTRARVAVGADERTNTIIVSGERDDLQAAAMIIEQLDGVLEQRDRDLRIFELTSRGKTDELAEQTRELYLDQLKSQADAGVADARIIPDADTNRLIVTADTEHLPIIEEIVETLDESGRETGRQIRVLPVNSSAGSMVGVISQMLADRVNAGPAEQMIISASPDDRSLVVNAPRNTIERVETLLTTLDDPDRQHRLEIRSYSFPEGEVDQLAPTLSRLFAAEDIAAAGPQPRFEPAPGNSIIVAATPDQFTRIETLIEDLQTPSQVTSSLKSFTLEHADPREVEQVLQQMVTDDGDLAGMSSWMRMQMQMQRQQSGETPIRITAAPSIGAVLVQGPPQSLALAEQLIENLDVPPTDRSHRLEIRSYAISEGDVQNLSRSLERLFAEDEDAGPEARFESDAEANRIMVAATADQFERIEALIEELQTPAEITSRIQTFTLEHADPSEISQVLQEMLSDEADMAGMSTWMRMQMRMQQQQSDETPLRITPARAINAVIVQASPQQLALAEELIENLDVPVERRSRLSIRAYSFPEGDVDELSATLARLFEAEDDMAGGPQPRFEPNPGGRKIIVAATDEQFERIETLVEELQQPSAVTAQIQTFTLEHADAGQVSDVLTEMITDEAELAGMSGWMRRQMMMDRQDSDETPVRITAVRALNTVIVQAAPSQLALAEQLIQRLDVPGTTTDATMRTVRLEKADAASLAVAVGDAIAAQEDSFADVSITPEPNSNSLLINGPDDAVQSVLQIIRDLDQQGDGRGIDVRIFRIQNGEAEELSGTLRTMLQGVFRRDGGAQDVTITVDDRTNSLIISARNAQFALVEELLAALDEAPERMNRQIRYVRLENADPFDVAANLRGVFQHREAARRPVIESDLLSNAITVIAEEDDLEEIEEMIAELDQVTRDDTIQVRVIPLLEVPAEQMAEMLRDVRSQMTSAQVKLFDRLPEPLRVTDPTQPVDPDVLREQFDLPEDHDLEENPVVAIAFDRNSNTLLLSGPGYELDELDYLVTELSYSFISSDADFRRFDLNNADPTAVAETLTEIFREQPIEVVRREGGDEREERVTQPQQQITVVPEPRTRSVIVRARPSHFEVVEELIEQLDADGVPPQAQMQMFALEHASPDRLLPIVEEIIEHHEDLRPGDPVSVHVDTASRSLIVIGRDHIFEQVANVIEQFDTDATLTEADVELVPLTKTNAATLATVLNNMLTPADGGDATPEARALQEQVRRLNIRDDEGNAVTLDLAQPIRITASEASNMLILTSTPGNLPALSAVAEMMDTVPLIEGVDVRLISLERADASTVQETLEDIFTQGQQLADGPGNADALPDGESGLALTSALNIAIDERTNTLILSGNPAALDLAETLAADLDQEVERFVTEVELFRLKHASAENLAPLLQSVFAESGSDPGAEGLATQVTRLRRVLEDGTDALTEQPKTRAALTVQADELTNTLIVAARSDMMPLISDVVETMDIPSATGMDNIRIIPLDHADAENVQSVIENLYEGPLASRMPPGDRPHITIDPRTNVLIVAGNEKTWGIVSGLIQQLDRELPVELRDVRMILVENAEATALASMIQQLLDARVEQREALGRGEAEALRVEVIADARTNALLVAGSNEAFEIVQSLAEQLDNEGPALAGQIQLIPLEHATAGTLATSLTNLFAQRYAAAQTPDVARRRPIIIADTRINALMVVATGDDRKAIDDLVDRLDRRPESPAVQIEIVTLNNNQAQTVAPMLNQVFTSRLQAASQPGQPPQPQEQVSVAAEPLTNALVVTASEENIEIARELIEQIDVEPTVSEGSIRTFTLEHAEASRAANTLQSLIEQGIYRPGAAAVGPQQQLRERIAVEVNPRANTLIVSASPENMAVIEQVVEQIDSDAHAEATDLRVFTLEHASASRLVPTLNDFLQQRRAGEQQAGQPTMPVSVVADDRTNTLLVTGGPESFATVERLIERLDKPHSLDRANYRLFPLENSTAVKVQQTLDQLFQSRPSAPGAPAPQPINVIADAWSNTVIVSAAAEDMVMVADLVEKLDAASDEKDDNVEIFRLAKADASQVAETVQNLYRQSGAGQAGQQVAIDVDERLNAIVVSAGAADTRRIGELVTRLDTEELARIAEIRVIQLDHARANDLATLLTNLLSADPTGTDDAPGAGQRLLQFVARTAENDQEEIASALQEGVLVTPDPRTNSLVISAPVDAMPLLEHVISRLDASSPQIARIRVFSLDNADAEQMAEVLRELFRLQQAASESERSIRYTLVRPDEDAPPASLDDPLDAPATLGTAEQNALTVTVDMRTNSLLVGGTEHYVELASEIIAELDASPAQERISRVYRLRYAQATELEPAIRDFLDQERQRVTQILGEEGVGTVQQLLDREIAIVAEESSNTLLISASPRYFDDVATLIDELDQPHPQVLIQVMLAEVTLNDDLDLGVEWSYTPVVDGTPVEAGTDFGVASDLATSGGFSTMVTGGDFQFLLRALQAEGRLEVLSRPQILAADNMEAMIQVGSEVPLVRSVDTFDGNQGRSANIEYEELGVILNVTPRISPDGFVNLTIEPEISSLSTQTVQVSEDFSAPIVDRRTANTQVSVQNGNTIIIGGLISTRNEFLEDKVPFFGDLPLIGAAFRSTRTANERTELLIILTPHIIHDVGTANRVTRENIRRSAIQDLQTDDPMRDRIMDEIDGDGVYKLDPEPTEFQPEEFDPIRHDLYEPRPGHELLDDEDEPDDASETQGQS